MRIILSTNNKHKAEEFKDIIGNIADIYTLSMLNIHIEPDENGKTLEENAKIKVSAVYNYMKKKNLLKDDDLVISDDTGIFIDYLDGAPGIYSARFLGENSTAEEKNKEILKRLEDVPREKRTAYFGCAIASIYKGVLNCDMGRLDGYIAEEYKDFGGFGYDPIFVVADIDKTYSEIGTKEKNKISHRYKAFQKLLKRGYIK